MNLPNGARFYRCALQVNPFAYLARHNKTTTFTSEDDYNRAIIESCLETGIEVIAVTDPYSVQDSAGLVRAARRAGLYAFSGFEAVTKDGASCFIETSTVRNIRTDEKSRETDAPAGTLR